MSHLYLYEVTDTNVDRLHVLPLPLSKGLASPSTSTLPKEAHPALPPAVDVISRFHTTPSLNFCANVELYCTVPTLPYHCEGEPSKLRTSSAGPLNRLTTI